jgi:asparaginyl-tRNA synthetase
LITSKYQSILRLNEDGKTVRAMDILFRDRKLWEDHKEKSVLMFWSKMKALGIDEEELWWYLDTRFGSAVHSGLDLDLKD